MFLKNKYIFLLYALILSSCANIVAPQGGTRDTTPPFAISSQPKDSLVNFNQKYIIINFSEGIQLKDAETNITISPVIKGGLSFEVNKHKLKIKLKNLKTNTTYTIKARNSIADLTEGNPLPVLNYVFSTGPIIDLNHIKGRVVKADNLMPSASTLVCLYKEFNDSSIISGVPDYFTMTDDKGHFDLENISDGSYKIVSILDKNTNKKWEAGEEIGYISERVIPDSNNREYLIRSYLPHISSNYLIAARSSEMGVYEFEFNYSWPQYTIINQEDPDMSKTKPYAQRNARTRCYEYLGKNYVVTSHLPKDSAHFNYEINGQLYHTAIKVSKQKSVVVPEKNYYSFSRYDTLQIPFIRFLELTSLKLDKITLLKDSSIISLAGKFYLNFHEGLQIMNLEKGNHKLIFKSGALTDTYGVVNDSFQILLNVLDREDLQTITIHTDSTLNKPYTLKIFSDQPYCHKYPVHSNQTITLTNLVPGKYTVKLIEPNENNEIKIGNIQNNIQPEKVIYYKEILLKTGFDIEETIGMLYN